MKEMKWKKLLFNNNIINTILISIAFAYLNLITYWLYFIILYLTLKWSIEYKATGNLTTRGIRYCTIYLWLHCYNRGYVHITMTGEDTFRLQNLTTSLACALSSTEPHENQHTTVLQQKRA